MATEQGMNLIRQYSDEGRRHIMRLTNDPSFDGVKSQARDFWENILRTLNRAKNTIEEAIDMNIIYEQMRILFRNEISRNNLFFVLVGFSAGTLGGFVLGLVMSRKLIQTPIVSAIAARSYDDSEIDLCKVIAPQLLNSDDIQIRVRSVSLNRIDLRISKGYGHIMRGVLYNYNIRNPEFPLVLGRGCSGVVEAVGRNICSGLEIGDEVWTVSPWYEVGLASEIIVVPETRVQRKPYLCGFDGAASLTYSGCIALSALDQAGLSEETTQQKRILIIDGSTPVGCVLTQLLNKWGAEVSVTCRERSAAVIKALEERGAHHIIIEHPDSDGSLFILEHLMNQLYEATRFYGYDVIFITKDEYEEEYFHNFLHGDSIGIINTVEKDLKSDNFGYFRIKLEKIKKFLYSIVGKKFVVDNGPHMCHVALDRLAGYVNNKDLQTVVDLVIPPQDIVKAVEHISGVRSIGNTIITFR